MLSHLGLTSTPWRHLTLLDPFEGSRSLREPVQWAGWRLQQNVAANLQEHCYQRQTGRTMRMLLRVLDDISKGDDVLIVTAGLHTKLIVNTLMRWLELLEVPSLKVSRSQAGGSVDIQIESCFSTRCPRVTVGPLSSFFVRSLRGRHYRRFYADNSLSDFIDVYHDELSSISKFQSFLPRQSVSSIASISGRTWHVGDIFRWPVHGSTVATIVDIKNVGGFSTCVEILFRGMLYKMTSDICDIFCSIHNAVVTEFLI